MTQEPDLRRATTEGATVPTMIPHVRAPKKCCTTGNRAPTPQSRLKNLVPHTTRSHQPLTLASVTPQQRTPPLPKTTSKKGTRTRSKSANKLPQNARSPPIHHRHTTPIATNHTTQDPATVSRYESLATSQRCHWIPALSNKIKRKP
ncbi:hypothetical protein L484_016687 [Morus notabilis]|uniref:Uncharacterized protein n=1 Tax=Morus notabilis TaxID=981085 RepID=W9RGC3_9ROSA|nr:hypothetical protein L484_016687 [Morus notabilis]